MKVIAISGYKAHELRIFGRDHPGIFYIKKAIERRLKPFVEEGLEWVVISGQIGVELWAADVVFSLQKEFPALKLAVLTPFLNQEAHWKDETKADYQRILQQADYVNSISKRPYSSPAQLRAKNEFIVANVDGILLLYDEDMSGTPKYVLEAAKKRQRRDPDFPIYFITLYDLQVLIEEDQNFY